MKLALTKHGAALIPADEQTTAAFVKLGQGELIYGDFRRGRNPSFHRLGMALLTALFEQQDRYTDFDLFRRAMAVRVGAYTPAVDPKGNLIAIPDSMSFATMDEGEFHELVGAITGYAIANEDGLFTMDEEALRYIMGFGV